MLKQMASKVDTYDADVKTTDADVKTIDIDDQTNGIDAQTNDIEGRYKGNRRSIQRLLTTLQLQSKVNTYVAQRVTYAAQRLTYGSSCPRSPEKPLTLDP